MYNYEATEYPNIYKNVYWGYSQDTLYDKEVLVNRNEYIKEWGIIQAISPQSVKYVLYQSQTYEIENPRKGYYRTGRRKEFADHAEFYKTKTGYAVITSPYEEYDEEAKKLGYERIAPLYQSSTPTYIRTEFELNRKSAKQYYLEKTMSM